MLSDLSQLADLLAAFRREGLLTEPEGLALLEAAGIPVPRHTVLSPAAEPDPAWLGTLPGEKIVLKVVSPEIAHKSDVGGVLIVPKRPRDVAAALGALRDRFAGRLTGVLVEEFVSSDAGVELLLGMRWTEDFGPVVSVGVGGLHAEFLAAQSAPGDGVALFSPDLEVELENELRARAPAVRLLTTPQRGQKPKGSIEEMARIVSRFLDVALRFGGSPLVEFEVNPLVVVNGGFVALDAMGRLTERGREPRQGRPIGKLGSLLTPRSVAVVGVSEKMNPGRIIVRNLLREEFDPAGITIVKPGPAAIDGCRCVPDVKSMEPVDLCVLSVAAHQVPDLVAEIVAGKKAESLIVIPGGLEEKAGTAPIVARLHRALSEARATPWGGPVICGGNSLGVRSLPGRIDTLFIPREKLPLGGPAAPLAFISNSGAFAVSKVGKFGGMNPRYIITAGNQMDLTLGDYVAYLAGDPEVRVFAVYVEGFRPLDGLHFARAARSIVEEGRTVVLYRSGRTAAGRAASASHTAAIAGDYVVTTALARQAGVLVAESLEEFEDLVRLATLFDKRPPAGPGLGAVTNAGFECVVMADNLGPFNLARLSPETTAKLEALFERSKIASIVDVHNPLDLTPMAADEPYEEAAKLFLEDPGVHVGVMSVVPLTAALKTVGAEIEADDGVAARFIRLFRATTKPWVAVVDAGPLFDALALKLEAGGVPTFRTVDRALRALGRFGARASIKAPGVSQTP